MAIFLTDGRKGTAHIKAEHIGYYNVGMFGYETGYFEYNYMGNFQTEILSNNKVRIKDGMGILGGRRFTISGAVDIQLDSGVTGEKRIDAIHLVHTQTSAGIEELKLEVVKGASTTGTPAPILHIAGGPIPDIATGYYFPMFLVEFNGVNITNVTKYSDFKKITSVKDATEYAEYTRNYLTGIIAGISNKLGDIVDFTPIVFTLDGTTEKYAGGYANRAATKRIIGGRVFMDIWLTMNNIGTLGTGTLPLRIKGTSSSNVTAAVSRGVVYSAAVSYVTGVNSGVNVSAAIAPGQDYITLYNGGNFLQAKDITANFQVRLSVSYDIP